METTLLALAVFAVAFGGMAIGVIVSGKEKALKGSCGGVANNPDCCMTCPDKPRCDDARALDDEELARVANRGGTSHPALTQAPR